MSCWSDLTALEEFCEAVQQAPAMSDDSPCPGCSEGWSRCSGGVKKDLCKAPNAVLSPTAVVAGRSWVRNSSLSVLQIYATPRRAISRSHFCPLAAISWPNLCMLRLSHSYLQQAAKAPRKEMLPPRSREKTEPQSWVLTGRWRGRD